MRVAVNVLESATEPRVSVLRELALMMALRTGSLEVGSRRSETKRFVFGAGEMCLVPRDVETWIRTDELQYFSVSQPFSATHFLGHCFGLIPASCSFASSAFPVPPLTRWVPPRMQPLALEAEATHFCVTQENGAGKRRKFSYVLPIG
jgi:hypothetical protein